MKKLITAALIVACMLPGLLYATVGALDLPVGSCAGDAAQSAVCQGIHNTADPVSGTNGLILRIANIVAVVAGMAAIIIIILAGLRLIQSSGNTEDIAGGRRTIIYASVGLVVIVLARVIVGLIISTLE